MEKVEIMLWINRIGLLLDLIAFWLMIPDLVPPRAYQTVVGTIHLIVNLLIFVLRFLLIFGPIFLFLGGIRMYSEMNTFPPIQSVLLGLVLIVVGLYVMGLVWVTIESLEKNKVLGVFLRYVEDSDEKYMSLRWGMILFSLGFLLQLIATF
jgi:hypothetical protein